MYVGELNDEGRSVAIAASIAGASTLAASANSSALRQAQREGTIDFLVNSLDEALRILKNEIRKCQPVAVAVSKTPYAIENEMQDRGVLPDLLALQTEAKPETVLSTFISQRAQLIASVPTESGKEFHVWAAPAEYVQNLAAFEQLLAKHLSLEDHLNRRWLRQSPRYFGPATRKLRSIACDQQTAIEITRKLGAPLSTSGP